MDAIARIVAAGRARWPALELGGEQLASLLAEHADAGVDPDHEAELYLACALACGVPGALAIFERELLPPVTEALQRLQLPGGALDEALQALRIDLLMGPAPRIAEYAGRGSLVGWLRVTATRRAFRLVRGTHREAELDDRLLEQLPAAASDASRGYLRSRYTAELKQAVADAFASLEVRQRNLLRQHVLDQLSIDELAALYHVHRATCARWIADAREALGRVTRTRLGQALAIRGDELESMLRFLDSDIELSLSRLLGAA